MEPAEMIRDLADALTRHTMCFESKHYMVFITRGVSGFVDFIKQAPEY